MGIRRLTAHQALTALCLLALTACASAGSGEGPASSSSTSASAASFGTLGRVCGPGTARGATATGVTNTTIEVSVVADVHVPGPAGPDQALWDSASAFADWCNAAGGIAGRKLILDRRDSRLSNYLAQVESSCAADFAMVGTMGGLDNTGVAAWEKCGIPNFTAATVSSAAANASLMFPSFPLPANQASIGGFPVFFRMYPGIQHHVGTLYAAGAAAAREQRTDNTAIAADGGSVVYTAQYTALARVNWASYVRALRSAGVQMLFLNDTIRASVGLDRAMAAAGWYPQVQISPPQDYDTSLVMSGGSVLRNYYVYLPSEPLEAASAVPAVAQYEQIVHNYVRPAHLGFFGEMAFSSWLLFATSAAACGSALTRACLEQQVARQTAWTGGGLQGAINPASNKATDCYIVMKIEHGRFVQVIPARIAQFSCDPRNVPVVTA